jgi:hypothetical protein
MTRDVNPSSGTQSENKQSEQGNDCEYEKRERSSPLL